MPYRAIRFLNALILTACLVQLIHVNSISAQGLKQPAPKVTTTLKEAPAVEKENTESEFFVVLAPGAAGKAQVTEVKFIRGDEKMRTLGGALKTAKYNFTFPDEARTKVIRPGTLLCKKAGECSFLMLSPE
jgi:hypothetical protein